MTWFRSWTSIINTREPICRKCSIYVAFLTSSEDTQLLHYKRHQAFRPRVVRGAVEDAALPRLDSKRKFDRIVMWLVSKTLPPSHDRYSPRCVTVISSCRYNIRPFVATICMSPSGMVPSLGIVACLRRGEASLLPFPLVPELIPDRLVHCFNTSQAQTSRS